MNEGRNKTRRKERKKEEQKEEKTVFRALLMYAYESGIKIKYCPQY